MKYQTSIKQTILKAIEKNNRMTRNNLEVLMNEFFSKEGIKDKKIITKKCNANLWQLSNKQGLLKLAKDGWYSLTKEGKDIATSFSEPNTNIKISNIKATKKIEPNPNLDIFGYDMNVATYPNATVQILTIGDKKQIKINDLIVYSNMDNAVHIR